MLRELFRNYAAFYALYEAEGIEVIVGPDGVEVCLWDIKALVDRVDGLPLRMRQAINLMLLQGMREDEAAATMGCPGNPVGMYATEGLRRLLGLGRTKKRGERRAVA